MPHKNKGSGADSRSKSQFLTAISNKVIGSYGERVAAHYLESKGYTILGRNIRLKRGEIDILAFKNKVIHIVEVKTIKHALSKASKLSIQPEDNFSPMKLRKLRVLREEWLSEHQSDSQEELDVRIDGLAIVLWTPCAQGSVLPVSKPPASQLVCKVDRIKVRHYRSIT